MQFNLGCSLLHLVFAIVGFSMKSPVIGYAQLVCDACQFGIYIEVRRKQRREGYEDDSLE